MTIYYLQDGNGNMIEASLEFTLDKENFESYLDEYLKVVISAQDWQDVAQEIDGRLENFLFELLPVIAKQYLAGEIAGGQTGGFERPEINQGQELDRWQLIARDLIGEMTNQRPNVLRDGDWVKKVWEELAQMPEMRIEK